MFAERRDMNKERIAATDVAGGLAQPDEWLSVEEMVSTCKIECPIYIAFSEQDGIAAYAFGDAPKVIACRCSKEGFLKVRDAIYGSPN